MTLQRRASANLLPFAYCPQQLPTAHCFRLSFATQSPISYTSSLPKRAGSHCSLVVVSGCPTLQFF